MIARYSNQTLNSKIEKLRVGVSWALNIGNSPWRQIKELKPDIILIHNLYPGFSSKWIRKKEIPRIYWLHNYRFFCLASTFLFQNQECLICAQSVSYKALLRKCADGSILKTISTYLRLKMNQDLPEISELDHWVTLSPKSRNLFLQTPLKSKNISIIPNFVDSNDVKPTFLSDKWVFVGRLSAEKGILALTKNLPDSIKLDIYGAGPARAQLEVICANKKNINLKGNLDRETLLDLLPNYTGGFVPSLAPEGIPTTFLEYSAAGLPIIGWEMNSTSDFIVEYECGVTLKNFKMEEIADAVNMITRNRAKFSKNSISMWKSEFSESKWIQQVNDLFYSVINHRNQEH